MPPLKPRPKPVTWTCGPCGAQTVSYDVDDKGKPVPKYEHRQGCSAAHLHQPG